MNAIEQILWACDWLAGLRYRHRRAWEGMLWLLVGIVAGSASVPRWDTSFLLLALLAYIWWQRHSDHTQQTIEQRQAQYSRESVREGGGWAKWGQP